MLTKKQNAWLQFLYQDDSWNTHHDAAAEMLEEINARLEAIETRLRTTGPDTMHAQMVDLKTGEPIERSG